MGAQGYIYIYIYICAKMIVCLRKDIICVLYHAGVMCLSWCAADCSSTGCANHLIDSGQCLPVSVATPSAMYCTSGALKVPSPHKSINLSSVHP